MVSPTELIRLRRELTGTQVLSTCIDAQEADPAQRTNWRVRLNSALRATEAGVPVAQLPAFRQARGHLEHALRQYQGFLPGRAWVAFATRDGLQLAGAVHARLPDAVVWADGAVVLPLLAATRHAGPVVAAVVDSRRARIFQRVAGELSEIHDLRADDFIDDLTDRNMSKRASTHSGVRGVTATDAAERIRRVESARLLQDVAALVSAVPGEPLIVVGGPVPVAATLHQMLTVQAGHRVVTASIMHIGMAEREIADAMEAAASNLRDQLDRQDVQQALDVARSAAQAALGPAGAAAAAAVGQVEELLVSENQIAYDDGPAGELVDLVLGFGGSIRVVSGVAADLLDEQGSGMVARLRYVRTPDVGLAEAVST